jgi:cytochrome o ubiquinol oxidase subunit IV
MEHNTHTTRKGRGSVQGYMTGFALSVALTLIPYFLVVEGGLSGIPLYTLLVAAALAQLAVQLVFFLHLADESKPRWNLMSFTFVAVCVIVLVGGTIWIFINLYGNMMPDMSHTDAMMYMSEH